MLRSPFLVRNLGRLAVLALLAGLLAACGSGSRAAAPAAAPAPPGATGAMPAEKGMSQDAAGSRNAAAPAAPAPRPAPTSAGSGPSAALGAPTGIDLAAYDRKIILNADLSLKVENARQAMQEVQGIANFSRGYASDANLTGSDEGGWTVRMVLKIPSGNYSDALDKVRKLGEVKAERQWSQDVTEQYIDLNARLKTLEEYEQRLRELALKANNFDEWLKLTQQVNDTRMQIESLTGRLRVLNNQVEFSTVNLSLVQPPAGARKEEPKPVTLGERVVRSFQASARAMVQIGEALVIFLAGFLPVGVVLGVVLGVVWVVIRAWRQRSPRPGSPPPPGGTV